MPIQHGIWKIGEQPQALSNTTMASEELLEELIFKDISILNGNWLLIGRQVYTDFGKPLDLIAIDITGSLIVIELKKHKTPRDVVAQTIDYASWVETLSSDRVVQIYESFAQRYQLSNSNFNQAFIDKFGSAPTEDEINSSHQMVVVAAELDASTERIINYLNDKANVAVNAVFFSVFQDGDNQYLSRAWMIDPGETEERAINTGHKGDWNGEYYGSFGVSPGGRAWNDALKYNFLAAGGGSWHSKTLFMLKPGDRVWVLVPKTGYVAVGEVAAPAVVIDEFVKDGMQLEGHYYFASEHGEDTADYCVGMRWIKAVPESQAVNEVGLFGNQNSVARPKAEKWKHTVNRLKTIWGIT
ncbi:MAG: DUF91 domain-containing protein [Gammaproteobacteria bacterium]|nr:DUF91 domain-containing protein [Gammaproteobacteria bacterium]MBQ0773337.1 DUF91 domain-containing protein [Gammaproteobacteria bacterium]